MRSPWSTLLLYKCSCKRRYVQIVNNWSSSLTFFASSVFIRNST
uniref:Uncharacterized protein n=1 Tax=Arundo donax TaxID=35708 RepID=A0A0A9F4F4_ARUDO